jgi:hypothetical protein
MQEEFAKKVGGVPMHVFDVQALANDETVPREVRDLISEDPDLVVAVNHLMNAHFQEMMRASLKHEEMEAQKIQYEQEVVQKSIMDSIDAVRREDKFDINKMWNSPEFSNYANDPENEQAHASYVKRFGFGTPEYFRHLRDHFMSSRKKYRISAPEKKATGQGKNHAKVSDDPIARFREYQKQKDKK